MLPSVLVADDSAGMRALLARVLGPVCDIRTVDDGQSAINAIRSHTFDAVLTDLHLPVVNGLEILLEARRALPAARLFLMSAGAGELVLGIAETLGATFLSKPFSPEDLLLTLKAARVLKPDTQGDQ